MKKSSLLFLVYIIGLFIQSHSLAQTNMVNVYGRNTRLLNGEWASIVDPFDSGMGWRAIYKDQKATGKSDFYEYSFEYGTTLTVPGDFNSQIPELTYFESSVWYKRTFDATFSDNNRMFLHFGAVNYTADVYFNGKKLGRHEGGFTPFQFEVTDLIKEKNNTLIVRTNSARKKNGIPGDGFDWFNYGGITRDVHLIKTEKIFVEDYKIYLDNTDDRRVNGYVKLSNAVAGKQIELNIPELNISRKLLTDAEGKAQISFRSKPTLWTPENPKLYKMRLSINGDTVIDNVGFRTVSVQNEKILLNGKSIFLRGVNLHEENPQRKARATSEADAEMLIKWAKDLGCNFIRLVHYPHNEYIVKAAEQNGLLIWEEIPVYQGISFGDSATNIIAHQMLREMIYRDKNRCNVVLWSVANETSPSKDRDRALVSLATEAKTLDPTRLVTAAFNNVSYQGNKIELKDSVMRYMDVIGVNEYMGWYTDWPKQATQFEWISKFNKPLIMSEFGGESVYNNEDNAKNTAGSWSEDYVAELYRDQIKMFGTIPFLQGTCPWILVDFRSPVRMQPKYQKGWNRKGLLSDQGDKKKAWFIMKAFYNEKSKLADN